tara:strand:+ start:39 stop:590 length:552 start_codon:yes stop_codon:yes gene_type:complete
MSTVILMLVCCGEVEATSKKNITNKIVKPQEKTTEKAGMYAEYTPVKIVEVNLDDMTFDEAFAIEHRAKGEGRTFWWRNNQYTTDLAVLDEFVLKHVVDAAERLSWVLNNDDPDDDCYSNKLDDCGVCDGPGRVTWWRDKDGDGLGTFMEWITSCTYPTDVEIKNYQAESLLEGGGDQGVIGD